MNFLKLIKKGQDILNKKGEEKEAKGVHTLRGGNSGCMLDDSTIVGYCPRETMLRYFGISKSFDFQRRIMFGFGELAEVFLVNRLQEVLEEGQRILTQEEAAIKWEVNGTPVTGRPDIIFAKEDGTPIKGIECKMASSAWTALSVATFIDGFSPKLPHIIQAAHYAWKLGDKAGLNFLPYTLIYVSPVDWHTLTKSARAINDNQYVDRNAKGAVKKLLPFICGYDIRVDTEGRVEIKPADIDMAWYPTIITLQGIERYYRYISECISSNTIPMKKIELDVFGGPGSYDPYDPQYNDYSDLHNLVESGKIKDVEGFLKKAKQITGKS